MADRWQRRTVGVACCARRELSELRDFLAQSLDLVLGVHGTQLLGSAHHRLSTHLSNSALRALLILDRRWFSFCSDLVDHRRLPGKYPWSLSTRSSVQPFGFGPRFWLI